MSNDVADEQAYVSILYRRLDDLRKLAGRRLSVSARRAQYQVHQQLSQRDAISTCTSTGSHNTTRSRMVCVSAGSISPTDRLAISAASAFTTRSIPLIRPKPARSPRPTRHWPRTSRCLSTGARPPLGRSIWPRSPIPRAPGFAVTSRHSGGRSSASPTRRWISPRRWRLQRPNHRRRPSHRRSSRRGRPDSHPRRQPRERDRLLAAMNANRTGQMRDIVETIQVEQDRIIRSDHGGRWSCRVARVPARPPSRCTGPRTCSTPPGSVGKAGGADRRSQRDVPAVHRAGLARPRRKRGRSGDDREPVARGVRAAG